MRIRTASRDSFKKILQQKMKQTEQSGKVEKKIPAKKPESPVIELNSDTMRRVEQEIDRYYFNLMTEAPSETDEESN